MQAKITKDQLKESAQEILQHAPFRDAPEPLMIRPRTEAGLEDAVRNW